jgi:mono/diheme cytochrome c family protein
VSRAPRSSPCLEIPRPLTFLFLGVLWTGCHDAPADIREWTPKDHTNQSNGNAAVNRQVAANPAPEEAPPPGLDAVTLAAWGSNCALCHGKVGRGDGPSGPMVKAPDLSNPEWQLQVSDSQIRETIAAGKKSMPSFAHLPSTTLDGLTLLVRWFNRDQTALKQRMNPSARTSAAATAGSPSASGPAVSALTSAAVGPAGSTQIQGKSRASNEAHTSAPPPP